MMLVCAALAGVLLVPRPAAAQEMGMMFLYGPNFLTATQLMTIKLQNLYRTQLVFAVAVLAANGTLPFYRKVTVAPNAMLDVLLTVACAPCTPVVFVANGQFGPSQGTLPFLVSAYLHSTATSNPITMIPWDLWAVYYGASLSATAIDFGSKFAKEDGCRSWSPGPVRLPFGQAIWIAHNYGPVAVQARTGCTNTPGEGLQGCKQTTTIQPLHAAMIQLNGQQQILPYILATPGTVGLNFAILQFTGPHWSVFQKQLFRAPQKPLDTNGQTCVSPWAANLTPIPTLTP